MQEAQRGFTLLELILAFALLGMVMLMVGSALRMATRSWDAGETHIDNVGQMRIAEGFLRQQFSQLHPWRWKKAQGAPLAFKGEVERLRYTAPLVARAGQGGISWFQLSLEQSGEAKQLVLRRLVPDSSLLAFPEFGDAEKTVLADRVADLKLRYYGREGRAAEAQEPTWRDTWEDPDRLPMLIELKIKPEKGLAWPELLVSPMVGNESGCRWDSFLRRCR